MIPETFWSLTRRGEADLDFKTAFTPRSRGERCSVRLGDSSDDHQPKAVPVGVAYTFASGLLERLQESLDLGALPYSSVVSYPYTYANGYYPLSPWAGLLVVCAYATVALIGATILVRRRDA